MDTIAPIRPAVQRPLRISLTAAPAAAAEARTYVREVISTWEVPVDPQIAALLTSELVSNAIRYEKGETIKLFIACSCGHLRVYVHDTCRAAPVPLDASADAETGRGLVLVDSLSTDWGHYRTPAGKAVYFTLKFEASPDDAYDGSVRQERAARPS
jgi:anti-sigma regulatory factor (Ser/Thr protein kinase)